MVQKNVNDNPHKPISHNHFYKGIPTFPLLLNLQK